MKDDIRKVAKEIELERDAVLDDPRWPKLTDGSLGEAERAELEAFARRSEDARRMFELYRPFDAEEQEALLARLVGAPPQASAPPALPVAEEKAAPAPVIPLLKRRRRLLGLASVGSLAAAAGLICFLTLRGPTLPEDGPIPHYGVSGGSEQSQRGLGAADASDYIFSPGSEIDLVLRPSVAESGPIATRAFLWRDGHLQPWDPTIEISGGSIHVTGPYESVFRDVAPGAMELVFVVGRPWQIPEDPAAIEEDLGRAPGTSQSPWQLVRVRVLLVDGQGGRLEPAKPLRVEFAGCGAVRKGPVCNVAGEGPLTLWIDALEGVPVGVRLDGKEAKAERADVEGGQQLRVPVSQDARELVVVVSRDSTERTFRLSLGAADDVTEIVEADKLRKEGKLTEATERLAGPLHDPSDGVKARAIGMLARIDRMAERTVDAVQHFREALPLDRAAGLRSNELNDRLALSMTLAGATRFAEARESLAPLEEIAAEIPEAHALEPYYAGVVAQDTGDLRAALRLFREAGAGARRLNLRADLASALQLEGEVLRLLGRRAEAEVQIRAAGDALGASGDPCLRGAQRTNLGWILIDDGESAGGAMEAMVPLTEAVALYRKECPDPASLANALTNLAHASLALGDLDGAAARLGEARRTDPGSGPGLESEWISIRARIAMRRRQVPEALALYGDLVKLADRALLRDARWQAALGRAEALDALGRVEAAREAYSDATRFLDEATRYAPLGEGKGTFLGKREECARKRVDFLVRHSDPGAVDAARSSRAGVLAAMQWADRIDGLDAAARARWEQAIAEYRSSRAALDAEVSADWKLPADELASTQASRRARDARLGSMLDQALAGLDPTGHAPLPQAGFEQPSPGEVFLVYHPVAEGWVGFAVTADHGTETRWLGVVDPEAAPEMLANWLLAPFHAAIASATRLRIFPFGALNGVDFHALPFDGVPLIARAPVAYGADLSVRPSDPSGRGASLALVVVDPRGDLPSARAEGSLVVEALEKRGGREPLVLDGRGEHLGRREAGLATHEAVRDAIEREPIGLLHYAGHGTFLGRDGWESGLLLAKGGRFSVGDVLVLHRAPELVLLSGCETARSPSDNGGSGLGLAQAFIVAGSRSAVASSRRVDDTLAKQLMTALYGAFVADGSIDLAASLRVAELTVRKESPGADWAAFRVLVP